MNPRLLASLLPIAVFWGLSRGLNVDSWVAILGGFIASAAVFYYNRKDRLIGALTAFGFVVVGASAVAGIVWDSEKAYLASGPIADFLFVPLFAVSIALRKPLIGGIARELFPQVATRLPINAPVFVGLTIAWAVYNIVHGVFRVYLLRELSVGEYIIWSRVLTWPVLAVLFGVSGWLIHRAAQRHALQPPAVEGNWVIIDPA
ncbi:MAG: hypothetical protein ACKVT1_10895 [Dehalococcoidia bacterium]